MKLTQEDIKAIELLIDPVQSRLSSVEKLCNQNFEIIAGNFDSLFGFLEKSRLEYAVIAQQMSRFEKRISKIESSDS